jgi:hypothetical protein
MSKIYFDKDEVAVRLGEGMISLTTAANVETGKNFCLIIHPAERKAKLGEAMDEYVGKWAADLPSPRIRLEFSSSKAVKVFIRQLRKVERDLRL